MTAEERRRTGQALRKQIGRYADQTDKDWEELKRSKKR